MTRLDSIPQAPSLLDMSESDSPGTRLDPLTFLCPGSLTPPPKHSLSPPLERQEACGLFRGKALARTHPSCLAAEAPLSKLEGGDGN